MFVIAVLILQTMSAATLRFSRGVFEFLEAAGERVPKCRDMNGTPSSVRGHRCVSVTIGWPGMKGI